MNFGEITTGDCLEIMWDMKDNLFDYSFTSPPYNRKRNDKYSKYNDDIEDYESFLNYVIGELLRVTKKHVFINLQTNYYNKKDVYKVIGNYAHKIQNIIIWEKSNPLPSPALQVTNAYELFLVLGDKPLKGLSTYTKNIVTTSVNTESTTKIHKAVMKKEVADYIFSNFIPEYSTIFDPMMGLGTTAIVAQEHNCLWYGCEIVPEYVEIAKERINVSLLTLNREYI